MAEPPHLQAPNGALVYLGLGSNLCDRGLNLRRALASLGGLVRVEAISRVYETEPVGFPEQPDFWNLAVRARTTMAPAALLEQIKRIERELGRVSSFRNAPRPIDIDILACDDLVLHADTLVLPHPRMHERTFVLYPLAEVAPGFRHPVSGQSISEMIDRLHDRTRAIPVEGALEESE